MRIESGVFDVDSIEAFLCCTDLSGARRVFCRGKPKGKTRCHFLRTEDIPEMVVEEQFASCQSQQLVQVSLLAGTIHQSQRMSRLHDCILGVSLTVNDSNADAFG